MKISINSDVKVAYEIFFGVFCHSMCQLIRLLSHLLSRISHLSIIIGEHLHALHTCGERLSSPGGHFLIYPNYFKAFALSTITICSTINQHSTSSFPLLWPVVYCLTSADATSLKTLQSQPLLPIPYTCTQSITPPRALARVKPINKPPPSHLAPFPNRH